MKATPYIIIGSSIAAAVGIIAYALWHSKEMPSPVTPPSPSSNIVLSVNPTTLNCNTSTCTGAVTFSVIGAQPNDEILLTSNGTYWGSFNVGSNGTGSYKFGIGCTSSSQTFTVTAFDHNTGLTSNSVTINVGKCSLTDPCHAFGCGFNAPCPSLPDGTQCQCYVINSRLHEYGCKSP